MELRPIKRHVLLLDDPDETITNGVVVRTSMHRTNMDYMVLRVGAEERCDFGQGDRVVLESPDAGRRLKIDGVSLRLVRVSEVIGVME